DRPALQSQRRDDFEADIMPEPLSLKVVTDAITTVWDRSTSFLRLNVIRWAGVRRMTKTQRLCAFCGAPGMTKQHVFGKRLLSLLDGRLGTHLVIDRSPGSTETKKRDGNVWSKQLRRVCSDCNNGWMRRLEEDSFDLLSRLIIGETTIVSKERQTKLAARLARMIMVAYLSREDVDAITNDER